MTSLLSGSETGSTRWNAYLTTASAGSVEVASLAFADPILTGSISNAASITLPGGGQVSFTGKIGVADDRPDEERVTRAMKKGRVVAVSPVAPPKDFSAGSILDKQSFLQPVDGLEKPMKFTKPQIAGKEIQIATAFYKTQEPKSYSGVPTMLASLVRDDAVPDVLATAYAPPPPDYARQSPFDTILTEKTRRGRYVPPIAKDDHGWAASILPAGVFSEREQRCLAAGVYFEARGESVKGQAAVAQVILNRVRNPTYPDSVCGVVYQNESWRNRCQFSFACDGIRDRVRSPGHWKTAEDVAMAVTAGKIWLDEVGSATHYHAIYVRPRWARSMKKVGRIGLHVFYRTYGGGWS